MKIIAFGHRSGVGKDTSVKYALTNLRIKKIDSEADSFAYHLKWSCHYIYGWAGVEAPEYYEKHRDKKNEKLPLLGLTPVELWIVFGTQCCRNLICDGTWINKALIRKREPAVLLISDLRFPNEAQAIKAMGGVCVRVDNPRVPLREGLSVDDELALWDGWDDVVVNDGSFADLNSKIKNLLERNGL